MLVVCPACGGIMGSCDDVEELIRDVRTPRFAGDGEESICYPDQLCPLCE
ncbi:MAG TPA: hypothetical protein VH092_34905 [Urbifossiella sp.]|nr:hypothetical protein [Urbifossiella sp.]